MYYLLLRCKISGETKIIEIAKFFVPDPLRIILCVTKCNTVFPNKEKTSKKLGKKKCNYLI